MGRNEMKARWSGDEVAFGAWCISGSPFIAETLALGGFHYVCLDMQHGLIGYETFLNCVHGLARTGTTPVVRVPDIAGGWIGKALDAGAEAIIIPMVETAEQAERAVAACRYYPQGNRSVGSIRGIQNLGNDPEIVAGFHVQGHPHEQAENAAHYVAAKHGVIGLMRTLVQELARNQIRVNSVLPTQVNTDMIHNAPTYRLFLPDVDNPTADDFAPVSQGMHLLPAPWVEPIDVSNAVLFLASEESRFITGALLPIDCGALTK